jgi:magnesium chelatase subunit D
MSRSALTDDAVLAARLFAIDPAGTGGVVLRSGPGPERDAWLAALRTLFPPATPFRRVPSHVDDERLLGGLDLAATLRSGRRVAGRGLLAEADGGILVLAMAERAEPGVVGRLAASLDTGIVHLEREGLTLRLASRFGLVALDEGIEPDEQVAAPLRDRLAFHVAPGPPGAAAAPEALASARARLPAVVAGEVVVGSICRAAAALGIASPRAAILALAVARAHAALAGRSDVADEDAAVAARLVLAPRATRLPPTEADAEAEADADAERPPPRDDQGGTGEEREPADTGPAADVVLAAARAAIPERLLDSLRAAAISGTAAPSGRARSGAARAPRGRPTGVRAGAPRRGERLSLTGTLRAAAPWQVVRRRERAAEDGPRPAVLVAPEDFRTTRFKARDRSTTIFVVDASGSAAMHRLAEAKGAVALLLEQSYVRRDRVALVVFRNRGAEVLLPPTRSLARARRCLEHLPGGGGTPLAAGLEAAIGVALAVRRDREIPNIVLLGDGRPNVRRDGSAGRPEAEADALAAARLVRGHGIPALCIDTAPRPQPFGRALAVAMGAHYVPLPQADAAAVSSAAAMIRSSSRMASPA